MLKHVPCTAIRIPPEVQNSLILILDLLTTLALRMEPALSAHIEPNPMRRPDSISDRTATRPAERGGNAPKFLTSIHSTS